MDVHLLSGRIRRRSVFALSLAAGMLASLPAQAVTSNWLVGTGVWSNPTRWSTNPLYPCNGQGGNSYDVVIAAGTATLDLDCTIDSLTLSQSIDGGFVLQVLGAASWTTGTIGGSGTMRVGGGLSLSSGSTKALAGTLCIHPKQVAVANRVYSPSEEEIALAREIIAAFEAAVREGRGAFALHGRMIDAPVVDQARAALARIR